MGYTKTTYVNGETPAINATNLNNNEAATEKLYLVGEIVFHAANATPTGYLKCNGAAVSRTTYAALFAVIGTTYGVGDGSTTFNLPDVRGEYVRGFDDSRGVDSGRVFGSAQADEFKAHTHRVWSNNYNISSVYGFGQASGDVVGGLEDLGAGVDNDWYTNGNSGHQLLENTGGAAETRPRNIAFMCLIRY